MSREDKAEWKARVKCTRRGKGGLEDRSCSVRKEASTNTRGNLIRDWGKIPKIESVGL